MSQKGKLVHCGKMNLVDFLDSTRIAAVMIVYLHCAISVSRSPITRFES